MSDLTPCPREDCKATKCEKMLDAVLPELLADVWDEGFDAGDRTARAVNDEWPKRAHNPYRQATA